MKALLPVLFCLGAILLLIGVVSYVSGWYLSPYLYIIGATMVALAQINTHSTAKSVVAKRLRRQQIFAALLLVLTGVLMFFARGNEWILSLSIAAVIELYTSIRLPKEEAKEEGM